MSIRSNSSRRPARGATPREHGAFAIITAMSIVALLGLGAIVVDLGMAYQERRELQNGADASALATTLDCVHGDCGNPTAVNENYGDSNASDNLAEPELVCGFADTLRKGGLQPCSSSVDYPTNALGWVKVVSSTLEQDGQRSISFGLARALGADRRQVKAASYSAWGAPAKLETTPLAISECEWNRLVDADPLAVPDSPERSMEVTVWNNRDSQAINGDGDVCGYTFLRNFTDCLGSAWVTPNRDWLDVAATTDPAGKELTAPPASCNQSTWQDGAQEFDVPVYADDPQDCGAYKAYRIVGYTHIKINAYKFSQSYNYGNPDCGDGYCMKVQFSRVVRKWETNFAGEDFGVISYRLFDPAKPDGQGS